MLKKITALLLVFAMTLSFAACGGKNKQDTNAPGTSAGEEQAVQETAAQEKPEYVINFLQPSKDSGSSVDDKIGKIIKEKFNIVFEIEKYAGDWPEKTALMLAAGDYNDLVWIQGQTMVKKYINAGALLELTPLAEENGPNFIERNKDVIPFWKMADENGKWYKWEINSPNVSITEGNMFDVLVRSDILEQQGYPELLDEDSYVAFLKKALADNPTTDGKKTLGMVIPGSWGVSTIMTQMYDKGKYSEAAGNNSVIWNHYDEVFEDLVLHPYYKTGLKFFNRLYNEGILDPESLTDADQQVNEKLASGRALSAWYITWFANKANASLRSADKEKMEYVEMPIMSREQINNGDKRVLRIVDSDAWMSMGMTKNAKHPERIMELLDWVATEEGQVTLGWGLEGEHYTVENGLRVPTEAFKDGYMNTPGYLAKEGIQRYNFLCVSSGYDANKQVYNVVNDGAVKNLLMSDRKKEVYAAYGWESVSDPWKKNKNFGFDYLNTGLVSISLIDPSTDEGKKEAKLIDYRNKNMVPLIVAKSDAEFESLYAKMIEGYKALDPNPIIAKYNELYENNKKLFEELKQ